MAEALVLDVLLVVLLVAYIAYGARNGLSRSLFVILGVVAGVIAAYFFAPLLPTLVPWPPARPVGAIVAAVILVVAGHALGSAVGRGVRRGIEKTPLSGLDRVLGAVVTGIAAALIASVLAASVAQLGFPLLSRAVAGSTVLRVIHGLTPDPLEAWLAELRGVVIDSGLPAITGASGTSPVIPNIDTGSAALDAAAQSVVRITGNAYACGVSQSGSGFVISDDRVITNAHVVAGVSEPVVEAPDGETIAGTIIYFDPAADLAVIWVQGLSADPLALGETATVGDDAAVLGYPFGGPFASTAADVMRVDPTELDDIYGADPTPREVYTLAANVRQGNSGGPLLALDGAVIGVVFATSADTVNVGYAMTMAEIDPVAERVPGLTKTVPTGECIQR